MDSPVHPDSRSELLPAVAIAVSRFNATITDLLLEGAVDAYLARGGERSGIAVLDAPGAFELAAIALAAARTGRFAGVAALGCLIHGQTRHDRYIAQAVATGLVNVTIATGLPVTFGVLTCETAKQASQRAGGSRGNKGADAMNALLDTLGVVASLHEAIGKAIGNSSVAVTRRPIHVPDKARPAVGGRRPMATLREIRRLAFQTLYQLDARPGDAATIKGSLDNADEFTAGERAKAFALAEAAHAQRAHCDRELEVLAPTWPARRQAAVDRAILRLAHYEMVSGCTPAKVAVNEAVELAKAFSTEKSPAFINGLLDKVLKRVLAARAAEGAVSSDTGPQAVGPA